MSRLWRESVFFLFLSVFGFSGCDKDIQMVSLGIDDIYYILPLPERNTGGP